MIKFLFKGIMRDRSRSLFPVIVVMSGVMLTVFMHTWIEGALDGFIDTSANFQTGHVKVMSQAYGGESDQMPNDLAYIGLKDLLEKLRRDFPQLLWTPRIRFGGLLDIPDEKGETRSQGPVAGLAVDLFSPSSPEHRLLNLEKSIVTGRLPRSPGEICISDDFARKLGVGLGETATLISSTMYGSMSLSNFDVVGTIRFGVSAMDRGAMIADIADIQKVLDMQDAAGEILGYFNDFLYREKNAESVAAAFNDRFTRKDDAFSPIMISLRSQSDLGLFLDIMDYFGAIFVLVFVIIMSIVLWNAGLVGSLRRYGEIGVRLAIGESKGHVYRSLIAESLMIGILGSALGTIVGLALGYYLQLKGLDIGFMMQKMSMVFPNVLRTRITPVSYVIGFIPGILATFFGTAISGIGVYKRQTSKLMKELEV
ncbi:MAG: ABC transporter permease [Candidatus Aminicenantes bacterium]|nr:ABC transporter permease [Candidatus Aminicenantes bacterium]